ncbi:unnamed protein product [Amaranthus hypochondriacus]
MGYEDHDYYSTCSDKKWKLFKKDQSSRSSCSIPLDSSLMRSFSQKNSSSISPPFINRSYSQKPSSNKLSRTSSFKTSFPSSPNTSSKNKSNLMRNFSKKSSAFGKKCTHLAKEQKARFYIMKRCVSMLVSWRKNGDS